MKRKLKGKLELKKETLGTLTSSELKNLKGGFNTIQTCGSTVQESCWCTVTVITITDCTCP